MAAAMSAPHHALMEPDETTELVAAIEEKIEQLHRDGRARTRKWLLAGFDVRGAALRSEGDAAAAVRQIYASPCCP